MRLQRLPGKTSNVILAKLEGDNPAGSVKDRWNLHSRSNLAISSSHVRPRITVAAELLATKRGIVAGEVRQSTNPLGPCNPSQRAASALLVGKADKRSTGSLPAGHNSIDHTYACRRADLCGRCSGRRSA